jgi:uncharacterized protein YbjT (DUF2867 family)
LNPTDTFGAGRIGAADRTFSNVSEAEDRSMFVVLGATGHIGSSVAESLLGSGASVTVVTRDEDKAAAWRTRGAQAAVLDVTDVAALRDVFRRSRRAFLLNPPASPSTDTDAEEHRTLSAIVRALEGSGLEKVVLESTYGAQPGDRIGDLSVLYDFEQALHRQSIPVTVLRAAYYMSNWDALLDAAKCGTLPTPYPADVTIPMVAPADVGIVAARLLQESSDRTDVRYIEGPARYSSADVAAAFAKAIGRDVELRVTPRELWEGAFLKLGFSPAAATAYARMTAVSVDGRYDMPTHPEHGTITLSQYIETLIRGRR